MRLSKRSFRHKLRYGFQPYFNKRGDRIPNPYSVMLSQDYPVYRNESKLLRLQKIFDKDYYRKFADMRYRTVGSTRLSNGLLISTVCLMVNYAFRDPDVPIIFETMVFSPDDSDNFEMRRYSRLSEARKGHYEVVKKYRKYKLKQQDCHD